MSLRAIDGAGGTTAGEEIMRRIGELLAEALPAVPFDDPYRGSLVALAYAAGRPDATSPIRGL